MKLKTTLLLPFLLLTVFANAQIPAGYYDAAAGKTGATLKTALCTIVTTGHTALSYDGLWTAFKTTDKKADGTVWDMYSNCSYTFVTNQCGNYSSECDCYNREHSMPKSWFNDATPMYTDLFHLVPTDGKVNGMRSNFPYGEVTSATYTSANGSKVGSCTYPGYTGVVFEPIDEYKGDFARNYFYMATRYENVISSWHANDANAEAVLQPNAFPVFETWFLNMLGEWSAADPVSPKETSRNNAVYAVQHNRNPYIDHPEYVYAVWGVGSTTPSPVISVTVSTLTGFTYIAGAGPSASQNYTLSGTTLSPAAGNITIAGTTDFEVSTNNTTFSSSASIAYTSSTLPNTIIYVRLKAGLVSGTYSNETILNSGGGATTVNVTCSGSVAAPAQLSVTPSTLSGFTYITGAGPSASQNYTLSGTSLSPAAGNITIAGTTDFEVSTNNTNYSNSAAIAYTSSTLPNTIIYVRLKSGLASGTYSNETIINSGGTAAAKNVTCSGSVAEPAQLSVTPSTLSGFTYITGTGPSASQNYTLSGTSLSPAAGNITIAGTTSFEVSTNNITFSSSAAVVYTLSTLPNTFIYVRLKAGLAAGAYSNETIINSGGTAAAINLTCSGSVIQGLLPEPSNYPGNFSTHNLQLQWIDASGTFAPTGYLIRMSSVGFSSIANPVDGTPVANNAGNINVAYGVQNVWFTNLTANTTYYFKLFGYTGSGSNIDYKTDGDVPQVQQTTGQ